MESQTPEGPATETMADGEIEITQTRDESGRQVFEHRVRDLSPSIAQKLRQALASCHWNTATQILDVISYVTPTERQWDLARKKVLDLLNDQDRQVRMIVSKILDGKEIRK